MTPTPYNLPTTMLAVDAPTAGGPEVLRVHQAAVPQPQAGELLIKVHAAGINRPDVFQREGQYPPPPGASTILGLEISGEVVGGDLMGTPFSLGDAVCALTNSGGYAQYCCVPAEQCLPIPAGLDWLQAAALPETLFTVWSNIWDRGRLAPGERLLVHGGASGIGTMAIQLAKARGHTVYATAGSDERVSAIEALGAIGINYRTQRFEEVIREHTQGQGVNVVLDMVAGDYINRNIRCMAVDGRIVIIATLGGAKGEVSFAHLFTKRITVTGSTLRQRESSFKAALAQKLQQHVWPLIERGEITPQIHAVFPLEQVAHAHALMDSGAQIGKILLQLTHP